MMVRLCCFIQYTNIDVITYLYNGVSLMAEKIMHFSVVNTISTFLLFCVLSMHFLFIYDD